MCVDSQVRIAELEAALAAKDARIAQLEQQVEGLMDLVAQLREKMGQNSRNSHKPPSSDPPGSSTAGDGKPKKKKSGRKRGGQRGHKGHHRQLVPESEVADIVDCYPEQCENCWEPLAVKQDPGATRYQVTEIPPARPETIEYRCHEVQCQCGHRTRGQLAKEVQGSPFGPRLMSLIALLTGVYHLSRRKAVTLLSDMHGVRLSVGAVSAVEERVSEAVKPVVEEAWAQVGNAPVKHTDGTSWRQAGVALAVWTIATVTVTVFKIVVDSSKATLEPLFGKLMGILVSDRATALNFWAMERRQVCWAHILRRFVSFSERDGPAGEIGRALLDYTGLVFEYWHSYKEGRLSRELFLAWMRPVRAAMEELLERAVAADIKGLSGSCQNLLEHRQALWTFVEQQGVEPTNNHAERELRAFVLWRKRCFGSKSERGNRFAERLMTVVHTARKQKRDVLAVLQACCEAARTGSQVPSLFTEPAPRATA